MVPLDSLRAAVESTNYFPLLGLDSSKSIGEPAAASVQNENEEELLKLISNDACSNSKNLFY